MTTSDNDQQFTAQTMEEAIRLFSVVGMPARGLSARTRVEYGNDLAEFARFVADRGLSQLGEVSLRHLEAYMAHLDGRGLKASSTNRKAQTLKSFFRFLHDQSVLSENIAARLVPPRIPRREPRFLSEIEYKELLRTCSHSPRDAALVELLLQTGMRLSEVAGLTWSDVELPAKVTPEPDNVGHARITRKGGKVVLVPLNYKACRVLKTWKATRHKRAEGCDAVFVSKYGLRLSKRAIQDTVAKHLAAAKITGASVHSLRHTMATHHIARGTDLKTVQETLGHADLATTALYVSLAKQAQKRALQEHAL
ncbi:MAG: tyrosine-type recombinase/integrase [Ardenticatenales bacterium]|nr:tyrosine-type recombinase/integrase [Ardenticatenales bacterium]